MRALGELLEEAWAPSEPNPALDCIRRENHSFQPPSVLAAECDQAIQAEAAKDEIGRWHNSINISRKRGYYDYTAYVKNVPNHKFR